MNTSVTTWFPKPIALSFGSGGFRERQSGVAWPWSRGVGAVAAHHARIRGFNWQSKE